MMIAILQHLNNWELDTSHDKIRDKRCVDTIQRNAMCIHEMGVWWFTADQHDKGNLTATYSLFQKTHQQLLEKLREIGDVCTTIIPFEVRTVLATRLARILYDSRIATSVAIEYEEWHRHGLSLMHGFIMQYVICPDVPEIQHRGFESAAAFITNVRDWYHHPDLAFGTDIDDMLPEAHTLRNNHMFTVDKLYLECSSRSRDPLLHDATDNLSTTIITQLGTIAEAWIAPMKNNTVPISEEKHVVRVWVASIEKWRTLMIEDKHLIDDDFLEMIIQVLTIATMYVCALVGITEQE